MPDTPTSRAHPVSPFLVEAHAAALFHHSALARTLPETSFDDLSDDVRDDYLTMARGALEALRDDTLPAADTEGRVLTGDQVSRILWCYDPSGTAYADVARLAHSHEAIRTTAQAIHAETQVSRGQSGQYLGELIWLLGHLADNYGSPGLLLPARLTSHVSGARAVYDPARYTVAIPLSDTA